MAAAFQEIKQHLRRLYLDDARPWLVGYSGGEESRTSRKFEVRSPKVEPEKRHSAFCILSSALRVGAPSCGNSRFGCWTCTVVDRGKASEGLLAAGDERMEKLIVFYETLQFYRDPASRKHAAMNINTEGKN